MMTIPFEIDDLAATARRHFSRGSDQAAQVLAKWAGARAKEMKAYTNPFNADQEQSLSEAFLNGLFRGRGAVFTGGQASNISPWMPRPGTTHAAHTSQG